MLKVIALLSLLVALGGMFPRTAMAKSYQIGGHEVQDYELNDYKYYKVKRATPVVLLYADKTKKTRQLPKGTVVIGNKFKGSAVEKPAISFYLGQLDYKFLNKGRPKNVELLSTSGTIGSKRPQDYQRIARPAYLPALSLGTLRQMKFTTNPNQDNQVHSQLKVTSNGFAEFTRFKNPNAVNGNQRPQFQEKIQKATNRGNTRQFYFAKKVPGWGMKRVHQSGKLKYRLTVVNQHRPFRTAGDPDDPNALFWSRYTVGGKTLVTIIGQA
ncbi:hypothetical protein FD25_GL000454 [Levilactobacillus acidifarinae DSM 19394]|uniref:Uncharacterized protein n=2 Tax=Levilactobacillus acidifarinae TaxID=267364 RepID=A0A0R1LP48_9LACO|nr:hypothetical protein FD25_GL000454 [Levilactobacillus acidifarinae DSM 19394]